MEKAWRPTLELEMVAYSHFIVTSEQNRIRSCQLALPHATLDAYRAVILVHPQYFMIILWLVRNVAIRCTGAVDASSLLLQPIPPHPDHPIANLNQSGEDAWPPHHDQVSDSAQLGEQFVGVQADGFTNQVSLILCIVAARLGGNRGGMGARSGDVACRMPPHYLLHGVGTFGTEA